MEWKSVFVGEQFEIKWRLFRCNTMGKTTENCDLYFFQNSFHYRWYDLEFSLYFKIRTARSETGVEGDWGFHLFKLPTYNTKCVYNDFTLITLGHKMSFSAAADHWESEENNGRPVIFTITPTGVLQSTPSKCTEFNNVFDVYIANETSVLSCPASCFDKSTLLSNVWLSPPSL